VAVANNAQLERDYAAARGRTRPVLLVVEGTLRWKKPDSGEMVKTLMADKDAKFMRVKTVISNKKGPHAGLFCC
jgi:copper homeostasis protein (lipoprotein)